METISYDIKGTTITVKNPIFVSIDRMAIAFAISNGVNCIYSNANNLTLFKGSASTVVSGALPQNGGLAQNGSEVPDMPKKNQMGGFRDDWSTIQEEILNKLKLEPEYLLDFWSYYQPGIIDVTIRGQFNAFLSTTDYTSVNVKDDGTDFNKNTYVIRSYSSIPDTEVLDRPTGSNANCSVYLVNGNTWTIKVGATDFTIKNEATGNTKTQTFDVIKGFLEVDSANLSFTGGGSKNNEGFLKILGQFDLYTLFDVEQRKIWYDDFRCTDNGKSFDSPTFYEVNAFFQALFEEDIDYMLIFPFLKNSSDPFSKDVLYGIERILDYMEISVSYDSKIDASDEAVLLNVLDRAAEKSKEYGHSISTLNGSNLLDYLLEHNLTPLYFYNVFSERYPVKKAERSISRKQRYKLNVPLDQRVLVKAVGGKKKYRGSPRRRTLRKTRKHR
jgi:hypothetical protein